jgi:O-antigen/teichoic acid export membrane protein
MQGDPPPSEISATASVASGSLGKAVGRGFSWLTISLVAGKCFGAAAQLLLGRWISDEQFRDFAIVASFAAVVKVFQDGGVPQLLIQRGKDEFDRLLGPAFWLSLAFGLVGGLSLAAAAPVIADIYRTPKLAEYLWIVACTLPLGAPATVLRAKLRIDLRFKAIAVIAVFWFLLRQCSTVGFAALGWGVMGLVLPLLLVTLFEWAAAYYVTRIKPWRRSPDLAEWRGLAGNSFWVVGTAMARGLARTGDYLVLGKLAPDALVGKYFFGYQITTQIVELLATNLQHVLFPALSRLANEPERLSRAIVRTIRMLVFVAAPASLGLAVIVRPMVEFLDDVIWNHKWSAAIPLMQIFAVAAPVRMFSDVLTASLSARGEFRRSALLTFAEGLWLMLSAAAAFALAGDNLAQLAAVIAASQVVFSVGASVLTLRQFGIGPKAFFAAFSPSWLVSLAAAAVALGALAALPAETGNIAKIAVGGAVFTASFLALARTLLRHDLDELTRVMPGPVGRIIHRVLLLPHPTAA